jgi:pimeloyl-ACP methyl ester carboxylesterase
MGGYVALTVMRKSPNRVEGLILLNTSAREDTLQRKSERLASIEKTEDAFTEERCSNNYYASLLSPYHDGDATLLKEASENACRAGFASFIRHQKACMNRISALDLLPDIKIPTLIVAGRDDLLIPLECQVELAARIPNSEFMIIEQCGHVAHLEHAETLNSRIAKFVKERVMRQQ